MAHGAPFRLVTRLAVGASQGRRFDGRDAKTAGDIDKVAAAVLLRDYLDALPAEQPP